MYIDKEGYSTYGDGRRIKDVNPDSSRSSSGGEAAGGLVALVILMVIIGLLPVALLSWFAISGFKSWTKDKIQHLDPLPYRIVAIIMAVFYSYLLYSILSSTNYETEFWIFIGVSYSLTIVFLLVYYYKLSLVKCAIASFVAAIFSVIVYKMMSILPFGFVINVVVSFVVGGFVFYKMPKYNNAEIDPDVVKTTSFLKRSFKWILKISIIAAIIIGTPIGYLFYQINVSHGLMDHIYYVKVNKKMSAKEFKTLFANNYKLSLDNVNECKVLREKMTIHGKNLLSGHDCKDNGNSIEYSRAKYKVFGKPTARDLAKDITNIVRYLKDLDAGYSKELAKFIKEFVRKDTVIELNRFKKWFDLEKELKNYNQISALRAYQNIQRRYK